VTTVARHAVGGLATEVALRPGPSRRRLNAVGNQVALGRRALVGALAVAVFAVALPARADEAPAADASARSVVARGACRDGPSHWRLALRKEPGGILLVRLVVKGGRAGQRWNIFMDDNGRGIFAGSRISRAEGLFAVGRRIADRAGIDRVHFAAHNVVNGNQCRGRAVI
jgi:hypothetical protein